MIPEISLILPLEWSEDGPHALQSSIDSLKEEVPFDKPFELIVVYCGDDKIDPEGLPLAKGLPFSVRVYQIQSRLHNEGETLGAWLAFGQILVFANSASLGHLKGCEVGHCHGSTVVLGWSRQEDPSVNLWATSKRTFWEKKLFGVTSDWPPSVSYVGLWLSSPTAVLRELHELREPAVIGEDGDEGEPRKDEEPNVLPRAPLTLGESFLGSPYRQWKWKHLRSVGQAKSRPYVAYCAVFGYKDPYCHSIASKTDTVSDTVFFTDVNWPRHYHGWTIVYMPNIFVYQKTCRDASQTMSRIPKLMPDIFLPTYVATLYIDNNIILRRPISSVLKTWLGKREWGAITHSNRRCAYKEIDACIRLRKDSPKFLEAQRRAYMKAKLPRMAGLAENPVLARVNSKRVATICQSWWRETQRFSKRDQISFAFVAWKHKYWRHVHLVPKGALGRGKTISKSVVYKSGKCIKSSNPKSNAKPPSYIGSKAVARALGQKTAMAPKRSSAGEKQRGMNRSKKLQRLLAMVHTRKTR
jgi:hypothetical protein